LDGFIYFYFIMGFELGAFHFLGGHSTTWSMPPALFCLIYFSDMVSHFCPGLRYSYLSSHIWYVIIGVLHCVWLIGWDGVLLTFCPRWPCLLGRHFYQLSHASCPETFSS
jgi:hypothetical protein